jgi:hypothetical protein
VIDPKAAAATAEWEQLMKPEAITRMSATLKGATTDREMGAFVSMMADPSVPS